MFWRFKIKRNERLLISPFNWKGVQPYFVQGNGLAKLFQKPMLFCCLLPGVLNFNRRTVPSRREILHGLLKKFRQIVIPHP
jgi:hypothetical protein